jgi:hypothetical protein
MKRFSQVYNTLVVAALAVLAAAAPVWDACLTYSSNCNINSTMMDVRNDGYGDAAFFYSAGGHGVAAHSISKPGVYAWSDNNDGVDGLASATNKSGVYGHNNGGGWGVFGRTNSSDKGGVGGENWGLGPGVWGHNTHEFGIGVQEWGDGASSTGVYGWGTYYGVYGVSTSGGDAAGVKGESNNGGYGVIGANGTTSGSAAWFKNSHVDSAAPALICQTNGSGAGVYGASETGNAGYFEITNPTSSALGGLVGKHVNGIGVYGEGKTTGVYGKTTGSAGYAVRGVSHRGNGGYFTNTSATTVKLALKAQTAGTGWAGEFRATNLAGNGVYIKTTAAGQGLVVEGGTKDAVVSTSRGKRALYAEEASEVYFTDYGFGKLKDGKAVIPIDPLFAETVNLTQDYFVFVQPYARAELFVSQTTPTAFEVSLNTGDPHARFAYRLVAKRKGFETSRLQAVSCPSDDDDSGPLAEKTGVVAMAMSQPPADQEK